MTGINEEPRNPITLLCQVLHAQTLETMAHGIRVARYSSLIAQHMGLSLPARKKVFRAALLHDIGKIGIARSVLNKPGRLTAGERCHIQEHPRIGRDILNHFKAFDDILDIVLHHHERFDGLGYPSGLKGEEIPLESRIIAVADTLDALTSDRCYRRKISLRKAVSVMAGFENRQFHSGILRHMKRLLPRFEMKAQAIPVVFRPKPLSAAPLREIGSPVIHRRFAQTLR